MAQTTILPKGELQGETTKSVMLSAESRKNAYIFDYKVEPPNLPEVRMRWQIGTDHAFLMYIQEPTHLSSSFHRLITGQSLRLTTTSL